jgi:hypothetical protein
MSSWHEMAVDATICRHVGTCQSVGSPVSSLASHRSRRGGVSRPYFRLMTGVCPDRRGSGTALAQHPSQQPSAQRRRQRAAGSLAGRLLPLTGGALGDTKGDRRRARPMVPLIPWRVWPVAGGR